MTEKFDLDDIIREVSSEAFLTPPEPAPVRTEVPGRRENREESKGKHRREDTRDNQGKKPLWRRILGSAGKLALVLIETVLLLVIALYGVMYVLAKGPSPTARNLFVMSVRETNAIGFLADLYLTQDEIAKIEAGREVEEYAETDTSRITIAKLEENPNQGPAADEWGLVDEDGDGIILEPVKGEGYSGCMMVVLDPSRVIMGSIPESFYARGYTVAQMVEQFDAVAGINAGGFVDPDGNGNGSIPDSLVVFEGEVYCAGSGSRQGFAGLDTDHILHVGKLTQQEIVDQNIEYGVSFGPVLISNGEVALPESTVSGLNPRTAIGQRSDGAILLLVIDGGQVISIGASLWDLVEIFRKYGAVNACNLDGGSSTLMWHQDDYINNCASVIGIRPVPTTFLVLKEGRNSDG